MQLIIFLVQLKTAKSPFEINWPLGVHKGLDPIVLSELDSQFENNLFVYVFERVGKFQGKLNVLLHQALELNTVESSYFFYPLLLYELLYSYSKIARKH